MTGCYSKYVLLPDSPGCCRAQGGVITILRVNTNMQNSKTPLYYYFACWSLHPQFRKYTGCNSLYRRCAVKLSQVHLFSKWHRCFLVLADLHCVCRITGTPQQLPRALEILSQHFRANPPREKPGGAPPAVAALLVRPGTLHMTCR